MDLLGSESVSPGGGTAAALTAALGLALVEMTARINAKKKLKNSPGKAAKIKNARERMENLMERDAAVFLRLSAFYKKKDKGPGYQTALKNAAAVPFEICERAVQGLGWAKQEFAFTGRWLKSDLLEAVVLLEAAFESGRLNVEINLNEITDKKFVSKTRSSLLALEKEIRVLKKGF